MSIIHCNYFLSLRYRVFIILIYCSVLLVSAQNYSIRGTVTDRNGQPLPGANVHLHETMQGTVTDDQGMYELKNIRPGHYHLHVEYLGYKSVNDEVDIVKNDLIKDYTLLESTLEISQYLVEESMLKTREKESTLKITMVDKKFMERHASFTLMNQLDWLPGINVMSTGTGISKPIIRGFSFNRVIVADRGIKQEGQQWGWDHGLEIDAFDVERVEILRGPASFLYGSDAIGGVIHIRMPEILTKNTIQTSILSTFRSVNDLWGLSAQARGRWNDLSLNIRFTQQEYGDYRVPADSFLYLNYWLPLYNQRLKNTAGKDQNFSISLGVTKNWGYSFITVSRVYQKAGFFAGAHGTPKAYQLEDDGNSRNIQLPSQQIEHWKAIWNNNIRIGKNWMEIDVGFQQNIRKEFSYPHNHGIYYTFDTTNIEHQFTLQTYTGNFRLHLGKNTSHWIIGLNTQYQQNRSSGFSYLIPNFNQWQGGIFLHFRKEINPHWSINAAARFDAAWQKIFKFEMPLYNYLGQYLGTAIKCSEFERFYINGSGNIGVAWQKNEKLSFRWNFGSSFRIPTVIELSADGIHHGTFRHEKGDSTLTQERGFQLDFITDLQGKNWNLAISPFFYYFHNFIYLRPTGEFSPLPDAGQIYQYTQANTIQTGIELQHDIHFTPSLHINTIIDYVFALNVDELYPLPFIPPGMMHIELEYELKTRSKIIQDTYFRLVPQGVLPQMLNARNENKTPGYILLNAGMGTSFYWKIFRLDLKTEVQNILNQRYMVHVNRYRILNLPEPGIQFLITATLSFQKKFVKKSE